MRSPAVTHFLLFLLGASLWSQTPLPEGAEFQVNTYTTNLQANPSVAVGAAGNFVVVWWSDGSSGTDTSNHSIQGQRFAAAGNALGGEFQINTYTTRYQRLPSVALEADGDFIVVWDSLGSSGTDTLLFSIHGQRFAADGSAQGPEFQVNSYTTGFQGSPSVAVGAAGNFVVVWWSDGSSGTDTSNHSIQGQRFDAVGNRVGGEFQVNTYTTGFQSSPAVALNIAGDFIVVWSSDGSGETDTDGSSIQGQRFDAAGMSIDTEFQINTYTTGYQTLPAVGVDTDANFVVVWQGGGSSGSDTSNSSIQGQRFDAAGNALGSEFQINSYTTSYQRYPSVALDAEGDFIVVWDSNSSGGSDTDPQSIQGQLFDAVGNRVGDEFQVNSYTTSYQRIPSVALGADGNFIVVWDSLGSSGTDTSSYAVQAQRFATPIFTDGFESGDTSAWSSSQ